MTGWRASARPTRRRASSRARSRSSPESTGEVATTCSTTGSVPRTARGQRLGAHRHLAPADDHEALVAQRLVEELAREAALAGLAGQEDHPDGRREGPRLGDALLREPRLEHVPGDRREDAGAVAGLAVGADAAAVLEPGEGLERQLDDGPARIAGRGGDEADAAGGVLLRAGGGTADGQHRARCVQGVLNSASGWDIVDYTLAMYYSRAVRRRWTAAFGEGSLLEDTCET